MCVHTHVRTHVWVHTHTHVCIHVCAYIQLIMLHQFLMSLVLVQSEVNKQEYHVFKYFKFLGYPYEICGDSFPGSKGFI